MKKNIKRPSLEDCMKHREDKSAIIRDVMHIFAANALAHYGYKCVMISTKNFETKEGRALVRKLNKENAANEIS